MPRRSSAGHCHAAKRPAFRVDQVRLPPALRDGLAPVLDRVAGFAVAEASVFVLDFVAGAAGFLADAVGFAAAAGFFVAADGFRAAAAGLAAVAFVADAAGLEVEAVAFAFARAGFRVAAAGFLVAGFDGDELAAARVDAGFEGFAAVVFVVGFGADAAVARLRVAAVVRRPEEAATEVRAAPAVRALVPPSGPPIGATLTGETDSTAWAAAAPTSLAATLTLSPTAPAAPPAADAARRAILPAMTATS